MDELVFMRISLNSVDRTNAAFGKNSGTVPEFLTNLSPVATCRQTVEAFLAPMSTAWQRMATGND